MRGGNAPPCAVKLLGGKKKKKSGGVVLVGLSGSGKTCLFMRVSAAQVGRTRRRVVARGHLLLVSRRCARSSSAIFCARARVALFTAGEQQAYDGGDGDVHVRERGRLHGPRGACSSTLPPAPRPILRERRRTIMRSQLPPNGVAAGEPAQHLSSWCKMGTGFIPHTAAYTQNTLASDDLFYAEAHCQ